MPTVQYRLYTSSTSTGAAVASLTLVRPGRIKAVSIQVTSDAVAIAGCMELVGVALNSTGTSVIQVNDPQRTLLLASMAFSVTTGGYGSATHYIDALDVPVQAADTISLQIGRSGTTPVSVWHAAVVYVDER